MRSIGYYRSDIGYEDPELQINELEAASKRNDLNLLFVRDLGKKQLSKDQLISNLIESNAEYIVVWRLDCLSPIFKNLEDVVSFLSSLSRKNKYFISIQDEIDTDSVASDLLQKLNSAWVELKRNKKIENARRSSIKAQRSGNIHNTGRKRTRDDHRIHDLRERGYSIREIARETGVSPSAVQRSLKSQDFTPEPGNCIDNGLEI